MDRAIQRKRLIYRATHRGTKEADTIIGGFVAQNVASMSGDELDQLEDLLNQTDTDVMDWLQDRKPLPTGKMAAVLERLKAYHQSLLAD
jgi:antitoxin CptB